MNSELALDNLVAQIIDGSARQHHVVFGEDLVSNLVAEMPPAAKGDLGVLSLVCQALSVMGIEEGGIWPQVTKQVCRIMNAGRTAENVLLREYFERSLSAGTAAISGRQHLEWQVSDDADKRRLADALTHLTAMQVLRPAKGDDDGYVAYELPESVFTPFGDDFALAYGLAGLADPKLKQMKPKIAQDVNPDWFLNR